MILALLAGACVPGEGAGLAAPQGTYPVESVFREFYNLLGGEKTLGPAISTLIEADNFQMQYTSTVLMRYDPQAQASEKFSLAPLGDDLHISDGPLPLPEQDGERIVNGYLVYDEFAAVYDALHGERFAGKPLTQVRVDMTRGRIEQYFTNLGFYRLLKDPPNTVHLLAYGAWKCDAYCRYLVTNDARLAPQPAYPEPFIGSLASLGQAFTGRPLTAPYLAPDGQLEQVYDSFVVAARPASIRGMSLRPISESVGFKPGPLVKKVNDDRLVFYPLQEGLGHEVPKVFEDYLTQHGGLEISGMPTTELFQQDAVYRQCFTNLCLDYNPAAPASERIRPAALGEIYLRQFPPPGTRTAAATPAPAGGFSLTAWGANSLTPGNQGQTIHIRVVSASDGAPAGGLSADLTVILPNGDQSTYTFPPTDASGQSSVDLPPIYASNGTIIPYQACLAAQPGAAQCVKDSYVIWGNQ